MLATASLVRVSLDGPILQFQAVNQTRTTPISDELHRISFSEASTKQPAALFQIGYQAKNEKIDATLPL